jgi:hypothetical protein
LAAGEEIYVEYGDNYFVTHDFLSFVPLSSDFTSANKFLKQFAALVEDDLVRIESFNKYKDTLDLNLTLPFLSLYRNQSLPRIFLMWGLQRI